MTEKNEVRITQNGKTRNYVRYLQDLLTTSSSIPSFVTFYGSGKATAKVVSVAETLKELVGGLEQQTNLSYSTNPQNGNVVSTLTVTLSLR